MTDTDFVFHTRNAWNRARSGFIREWMVTATPYFDGPDVADAPDWVTAGVSPAQWLALPVAERQQRTKQAAYDTWNAAYPKPPAAGDPTPRRRPADAPTPAGGGTPGPTPAVAQGTGPRRRVSIDYRDDLAVIRDPEAEHRLALSRALVLRLTTAPAAVTVAEPVAVAVAVPDPSPSSRAVVLCGRCGEFVPARAGRAVVPAVGGRCRH